MTRNEMELEMQVFYGIVLNEECGIDAYHSTFGEAGDGMK